MKSDRHFRKMGDGQSIFLLNITVKISYYSDANIEMFHLISSNILNPPNSHHYIY